MFDTMIVLAPSDISDLIIADLRRYRPDMRMIPIVCGPDLIALPSEVLANARLIGFTTPVIVPPSVLAALGYGAYNFHPGPPSYPGLAPAQMAIYEGAQIYGATIHVMTEKVDAGPIVAAQFCTIAPGATVVDLEMRALGLLAQLLKTLGPMLVGHPAPLPLAPIIWSPVKSSRRTLAGICHVSPDIEPGELDRRIRAFGVNHFGMHPTVMLHGYRFRYVDEASLSVVVSDNAEGAGSYPAPVVHSDRCDRVGAS